MSVKETLAASEIEQDPDLEGVRILLACAWACSPRTSLAHFIAVACLLMPELRQFDPALVSSVALRMNLPLEVV